VVVVELGAAVAVLEAVHVLSLVRAGVVVVEDAVAVTIVVLGRRRGRRGRLATRLAERQVETHGGLQAEREDGEQRVDARLDDDADVGREAVADVGAQLGAAEARAGPRTLNGPPRKGWLLL